MKPKVFLSSGHYQKWAIGDDLLLTKSAIKDIVELTDLDSCEVAHFTWWEGITNYDIRKLIGKKVICHMTGEPFRYLKLQRFNDIIKIVGKWVSQSTEAVNQLNSVGFKNELIPYIINDSIFKPTEFPYDVVNQWKIPRDSYLISNFHRDTEGSDLISPKLVKGPDIFLEIVKLLKKHKIHVILAGPRRFWLRKQLEQNKIDFTYIGKNIQGDDIDVNVLDQALINKLYNISDLYIVSSRSEGGPRTLLESTASKCKVVSTTVGLANDVLLNKCIYKLANEASTIIEKDIDSGFLNDTTEEQYNKTIDKHTLKASIPLFDKLYGNINDIPIFKG
jgi:glycosyltransferase involved in cell wall biosynthesis